MARAASRLLAFGGRLGAASALSFSLLPSSSACDASAAPAPALSPKEFRSFKLLSAKPLTRDTALYTFALPRENDELGVPVAGCLQVRAADPQDPAKQVVRPYTPTSDPARRGSFELIVKAYEPSGKVSRAFARLRPGDSLEMKGPFVKFAYEPNSSAAIGMVAGGTGITPMYQMLLAILKNPRDRTEVRLVYASKTPEDIILKRELDALAITHPNFKVLYTVSSAKPADHWDGATGHVSKEMLTSFLPPPGADGGSKVLVCGPPGFMKALSGEKKSPSDQGELAGMLKDLHFSPQEVFKF